MPTQTPSSRLLIACALKREATVLQKQIGGKARVEWTGLGGRKTGRRVRALLEDPSIQELWFTGACGALAPGLEVGHLVLPADWILQNGEAESNSPDLLRTVPLHLCRRVDSGLTVRRPVILAQTRRELFTQTGASVCDMECFYALRAARPFGVPAMAFKVVTDNAESGLTDFWRHFDRNMARVAEFCNRLLEAKQEFSNGPAQATST